MDTRDRNKPLPHQSISEYAHGYLKEVVSAMDNLDKDLLEKAARELFSAKILNKRIFVAGNGGSAAISEHLLCDWKKGCHIGTTLQVQTLTGNMALLTAIGNDIGYDQIFSYQLELAEPKPGELVVLISSSGNSPNIIKAAEFALDRKMVVIGMCGFNGGRLKELSDIPLHVPVANYGVVEDCHQMIMHILAQQHYLTLREPS